LQDIPSSYLLWAVEHLSHKDAQVTAWDELERRRDYA